MTSIVETLLSNLCCIMKKSCKRKRVSIALLKPSNFWKIKITFWTQRQLKNRDIVKKQTNINQSFDLYGQNLWI